MTTETKVDRSSLEQVYTTASSSHDLRQAPGRRTAADVLMASALSRSEVGWSLMRLQAEWDGAAKPRMPDADYIDKLASMAGPDGKPMGRAGAHEYARAWWYDEIERAMKRLPAFGVAHSAAARMALTDSTEGEPTVVDAALLWLLHPHCDACGGTGNSPRARLRCPTCKGSGERTVPYGMRGLRLVVAMGDAVNVWRDRTKNRLAGL